MSSQSHVHLVALFIIDAHFSPSVEEKRTFPCSVAIYKERSDCVAVSRDPLMSSQFCGRGECFGTSFHPSRLNGRPIHCPILHVWVICAFAWSQRVRKRAFSCPKPSYSVPHIACRIQICQNNLPSWFYYQLPCDRPACQSIHEVNRAIAATRIDIVLIPPCQHFQRE